MNIEKLRNFTKILSYITIGILVFLYIFELNFSKSGLIVLVINYTILTIVSIISYFKHKDDLNKKDFIKEMIGNIILLLVFGIILIIKI